MSDELQALAFLAGANSIFYGEKPDHRQPGRGARPRVAAPPGINGQDVVLEHEDAAGQACGVDGHAHSRDGASPAAATTRTTAAARTDTTPAARA